MREGEVRNDDDDDEATARERGKEWIREGVKEWQKDIQAAMKKWTVKGYNEKSPQHVQVYC